MFPYPNGDISMKEGVYTDAIIRAFQSVDIDLQQLIHEDITHLLSKYKNIRGVCQIDTSIDHRRVLNMVFFFDSIALLVDESEARPADIVVWDLTAGYGIRSFGRKIFHSGRQVLHIGILSNKKHKRTPLVIHNISSGVHEEDFLHAYKILRIYRFTPEIFKELKGGVREGL